MGGTLGLLVGHFLGPAEKVPIEVDNWELREFSAGDVQLVTIVAWFCPFPGVPGKKMTSHWSCWQLERVSDLVSGRECWCGQLEVFSDTSHSDPVTRLTQSHRRVSVSDMTQTWLIYILVSSNQNSHSTVSPISNYSILMRIQKIANININSINFLVAISHSSNSSSWSVSWLVGISSVVTTFSFCTVHDWI